MATHTSNNDVFKLKRTQYTQRHINSVGDMGCGGQTAPSCWWSLNFYIPQPANTYVNQLLFVAWGL